MPGPFFKSCCWFWRAPWKLGWVEIVEVGKGAAEGLFSFIFFIERESETQSNSIDVENA